MSKKKQPICQFKYPKPPMKCTKHYHLQMKKDNNSTFCETTFQIFKNLIDMRLGLKILFA
jgi:hypothetical protein